MSPQAKTSKSGHAIFISFFRRVRATSMTRRRVENTRVQFWTFSPVSVKSYFSFKIEIYLGFDISYQYTENYRRNSMNIFIR